MLFRCLAVLSLLLGLSACGRPSLPVARIAVGANNPDPGYAGYVITADTGVYRITWIGFKELSGTLIALDVPFGLLTVGCTDHSCTLGSSKDRVTLSSPNQIDFDSFPISSRRSGFDVELPTGTLQLDLLVDHEPRPDLVLFISADTEAPAAAPAMAFGLTM